MIKLQLKYVIKLKRHPVHLTSILTARYKHSARAKKVVFYFELGIKPMVNSYLATGFSCRFVYSTIDTYN